MHYTVKDGLMSNDVKGIFQDSLGVIWVANGLGFTKFYGDGRVENLTGFDSESNGYRFKFQNNKLFNYRYIVQDNILKKRKFNKGYLLIDYDDDSVEVYSSDYPDFDFYGNQYFNKIVGGILC